MNTFVLAAMLVAAPPEQPKGKLVVVGGGSTPGAITKKTIELAGGESCRMVILPQSSSYPDAGESSEKHWREHGATNVTVVKWDSLIADEVTRAIEQVKKADLIWMPGGDQNRFMKAVADTGIGEAMRERYRHGATIGGTSAGAAVMSTAMITGKADVMEIRSGGTELAEGLGLWPGVLVDQHFLKRQRINRLLSAVLDRPELVGVGIDESTAAIVFGTKFEAFGAGQVLVIDARSNKKPGKAGELSTGRDIKFHLLTNGMTLDVGK